MVLEEYDSVSSSWHYCSDHGHDLTVPTKISSLLQLSFMSTDLISLYLIDLPVVPNIGVLFGGFSDLVPITNRVF